MFAHATRILRTTGFRLAALYAGLFGVSVFVLFGVIYWITSGALHQQLEFNIQGEVSSLVEDHKSGGLLHVVNAIELRLGSNRQPTTFYLLLDAERRKAVGNLPGTIHRDGWQRLPDPEVRNGDAGGDPEERDANRILAFGKTLPDGSFLLVGEDTYRIVEVEEAVIRAFGWAVGATILLAAAGGVTLSVGFLRRIDAINQTSQAIIEGKLADRVPTRGTGDELDRLAQNLNAMLDQVQALMESLRQVSNDIAHDLRTPLSRLRQRLEQVRLKARSAEDYETAVDQAIIDADAILGTFSALLRIAQIEAGTRRAAFSKVDLSDVFRSISAVYGAVAEDGGQTLLAMVEPGISIQGDRELLTQMLANLVENAIRHTPKGTQIMLCLRSGAAGAIGIVADSGPGIPVEAREKVFQQFFRLEVSRTTAGNGLGLSLVAAVAEIHGILITLEDNAPGLKVRLDFKPRPLA